LQPLLNRFMIWFTRWKQKFKPVLIRITLYLYTIHNWLNYEIYLPMLSVLAPLKQSFRKRRAKRVILRVLKIFKVTNKQIITYLRCSHFSMTSKTSNKMTGCFNKILTIKLFDHSQNILRINLSKTWDILMLSLRSVHCIKDSHMDLQS
jgi:hypothetical protein